MMGCKREGEMGTLALDSDRFLGEIGYMTKNIRQDFILFIRN